MDRSLKVALITGCSSGFGLLTAIELAKTGFRVFATMRNLSKRDKLDAAARAANVTVDVIELDVTKEKSITDAVNHIYKETNRIDVLVNNAGIQIEGFVEEVSLEEVRELFETNFFGLVAVTKAVYPKMRERHSGRIINIASFAGFIGLPNTSTYAASKFAVEGFSESLRYEGLLDGIWVSLIEPATSKTGFRSDNLKLGAKTQDPTSPHYEIAKNMTNSFNEFIEKNSMDPMAAVKTIVKVANSNKPKFRYRICSKMEKVRMFIRSILPEFLWEKALLSQFKIKK